MRIEQLEYFLTVARYGSLSQAAANIYVGQPTLSAAIASLEKELGKKLFNRTRRGMELTSIGEDLIPMVEKTIDDFYAIKKKAGLNALNKSHLHLLTANPCKPAMIEAISRSQEVFTSVHFYLHHQMAGDVMKDIQENRAVIGVSACRDYCLERHREYAQACNLRFVPIYNDHLILFCHASGQYQALNALSFEDLLNEDYQVAIPTDFIHQGVFKEQSELASIPGLVGLDDQTALHMFVLQNDCIGLTTKLAALNHPLFSNGLFNALQFTEFPINLVHYLVYSKDQSINDVEADIIQQIESYYERLT